MNRALLVLACSALVGCNDPAEFRPAKTPQNFPAAKDAYRVRTVDQANCTAVGMVFAHGDDAIERIAKTAANHGATHYVIRDEASQDEYVTDGHATRFGNVVVAQSRTHKETNRSYIAQAFHCTE